ncbi:MAG TPA: hypothetical protein VFX76_20060, partial [Roseiflexaceae bacterium]|nr:hypothetical protein [Roseiflexaceae bacterium]
SARLRYLGEYPMLPDNSQRADAEYNVHVRAAYTIGSFMLYGELLNVFDHEGKDVVYYYETNVPGRGLEEGRVSRAEEPRTVRAGIKYKF